MPDHPPRSLTRWMVAALAVAVVFGIGAAAVPRAAAEAVEATATVEVTVWQSVLSGRIYLSTRPEDGEWTTHQTPLDMSRLSESRRFYQGSAIEVDVPVEVSGEERTATVEVTVWWRVLNGAIYLSTRPRGGEWTTHQTPLDMSQLSRSGRFYQGSAITVDVPVVVDEGSVEGDRAALVAFYYATDGPNWRYWGDYNDGWLSDGPLDSWHGVWTNDDGRVTRLDRDCPPQYISPDCRISLRGSIPPALGNLTKLEYLDLSGTGLSGEIPPELGSLTKLEYLNLGPTGWEGYGSSNQLSGAIPPELGNLTNLRVLDLAGNQLSGVIPPEFGNLTNLEYLNLNWNGLSGEIPLELTNLAKLEHLALGRNDLSGAIPPELGNLTSLRTLNLSGNDLSGAIPPELGNLTNIEYTYSLGAGVLFIYSGLSLSGNQLTGCIPSALADVDNDFDETGLPLCDN